MPPVRGILLAERLGLGDLKHFGFFNRDGPGPCIAWQIEKELLKQCFKHLEEIRSNAYLVPLLSERLCLPFGLMLSVAGLEEAVNIGDNPRTRQLARESWKWGMHGHEGELRNSGGTVLRGIEAFGDSVAWLMGERDSKSTEMGGGRLRGNR